MVIRRNSALAVSLSSSVFVRGICLFMLLNHITSSAAWVISSITSLKVGELLLTISVFGLLTLLELFVMVHLVYLVNKIGTFQISPAYIQNTQPTTIYPAQLVYRMPAVHTWPHVPFEHSHGDRGHSSEHPPHRAVDYFFCSAAAATSAAFFAAAAAARYALCSSGVNMPSSYTLRPTFLR